MSDYGAPIPPLEPRPDQPAPQASATLDEVRALLQQQRREIDRLRSRSRWILIVAVLAMFGACGNHNTSSDSSDSQVRQDVSDTKTDVEQLVRQNDQLQRQIQQLDKKVSAAKPTG